MIVLRLAWRLGWGLMRRRPGRSLLLAAAIAAPVAIGVATSSVLATSHIGPDERARRVFGNADARTTLTTPVGDGNATLAAIDDAFTARLPADVNAIPDIDVRLPVQTRTRMIRTVGRVLDLADDLAAPIYRFDLGRAPRDGTEVAVSSALADRLGVQSGDQVGIGDSDQPLTVTARVGDRDDLTAEFVAVHPDAFDADGTLATALEDPASDVHAVAYRWLLTLPRHVDDTALANELRPHGYDLVPRRAANLWAEAPPVAEPAGIALGAALLAQVALFVGAAFAIVVRGMRRQLGVLAAIGGRRRIRTAGLVAHGLVLGVTGAAGGAAVGLVFAWAASPLFAARAATDWGAFTPAYGSVAALVCCAVVAAVVAAYWPARAAGKADAGALLRDVPTAARTPSRYGGVASAVLVVAAAATVAGTGMTGNPLPAVVGAVLGILGSLALLTAVGRRHLDRRLAAARPATRIPLRALLAMPGRTVAVGCGVAVVLGVAVTVLAGLSSGAAQEARLHTPVAPEGAAVVRADRPLTEREAEELAAQAGASAVGSVTRARWAADVVQPMPAYVLTDRLACAEREGFPADRDALARCPSTDGPAHDFPRVGVADLPTVSALAGRAITDAEREAYEDGAALTIGIDGTEFTVVRNPDDVADVGFVRLAAVPAIRVASGGPYAEVPAAFVSADTAAALGFAEPAPSDVVTFLLPERGRTLDETAIRPALPFEIAGRATVVVEAGPPVSDALNRLFTYLVGATLLTSAGSVAVAVALWSSDLRNDYLMLGAIGAGRALRRRAGAWHGVVLAGVSLLVATLWGLAAASSFLVGVDVPLTVPAGPLAILATSVLAAAAVVGAMLVPAGAAVMRRPV